MSQEVILGLGIFIYLLWMLFDRIGDEHVLFKYFIIFVNSTILLFIPLNLLGFEVGNVFLKIGLRFWEVFWAYVITMIVVFTLVKTGMIIPKESRK